MAEWSKALCSLLLWAWVRIPLLAIFFSRFPIIQSFVTFFYYVVYVTTFTKYLTCVTYKQATILFWAWVRILHLSFFFHKSWTNNFLLSVKRIPALIYFHYRYDITILQNKLDLHVCWPRHTSEKYIVILSQCGDINYIIKKWRNFVLLEILKKILPEVGFEPMPTEVDCDLSAAPLTSRPSWQIEISIIQVCENQH